METLICLAIEEPSVAHRVGSTLSGFGHRTVDCGWSTCPSRVNAIVTDRSQTDECRRGAVCRLGAEGEGSVAECTVPLIRLGSAATPANQDTAFATLPEECADEQLLIAVARAIRYQAHLVAMSEVRRPARP